MTPEEKHLLVQMREAYVYPDARVWACPPQNEPDVICGECAWVFEGEPWRQTDAETENEIGTLLRSPTAADNRRGLACVVYWGFLTRSGAFARHRVGNLINGSVHRVPLADPVAVAKLANAVLLADAGQLGDALHALHGLRELSQMPFASKAIAFIAPAAAGVYDNRLNDALTRWLSEPEATLRGSLAREARDADIVGRVGSTRYGPSSTGYQGWCSVLQTRANNLNGHFPVGAPTPWTDRNGHAQAWRAVDVERAIFQLAA